MHDLNTTLIQTSGSATQHVAPSDSGAMSDYESKVITAL